MKNIITKIGLMGFLIIVMCSFTFGFTERAYYKCNGNTGTDLTDENGAFTMTETGSVSRFINGYDSFARGGDYSTNVNYFRDITHLNYSHTLSKTFDFWLYMATDTTGCLMGSRGGAGYFDMRICYYQNGNISFDLYGTGTSLLQSDSLVSTTTWTHIIARYDGTTKEQCIEIDGVEKCKFSTVTNTNVGTIFRIGDIEYTGAGGLAFAGSLDEIKIYDEFVQDVHGNITLVSPINNYRSNTQLNVSYYVNDTDDDLYYCDFYLNDKLYYHNISVANDTVSNMTTYNISVDGNYSYHFNCTDTHVADNLISETKYYIFDNTQPFINSILPNLDNSTIYETFLININGNSTDDNLYRVNRTIFYPNGTIFNFNSTDNISNNSLSWNQDFNMSCETNGNYTLLIESWDSHTDKYLPSADFITKDSSSLQYYFKDETIRLFVTDYNKDKVLENIETIKFDDRYNFILDFDKKFKEDDYLEFEIVSDKSKIIYLPNSEYDSHLIIGNYWLDFEGVPNSNHMITKISDRRYKIKIIFTKDKDEKIEFKSLGLLNYNNLSVQFLLNISLTIDVFTINDDSNFNTTDTTPSIQIETNQISACSYSLDGSPFINFTNTGSLNHSTTLSTLTTGEYNLSVYCVCPLGYYSDLESRTLNIIGEIDETVTAINGISTAMLLFLEFALYIVILGFAMKTTDEKTKHVLFIFGFLFGLFMCIFSLKNYLNMVLVGTFALFNAYMLIVVTFAKK